MAALHWATSGFQYVPGPIYASTNSGADWALTGAPNLWWTAAACSADASTVVAAGESVYTSTNSGATGTTYSSPSTDWASVASSADGNKLVAAVNGGGIYTSQSTPAPALSITASGANIVHSWIVPSLDFSLQENSELTPANWMDVTNTPTLNLTNLQNQVTVPPPTGNRFYRLKHAL
ncbi:MAG TPA: hypothetical protein VNH84_03020 [Candidatus Saccharimonadales bacterium]|nr:hypothetical protein [Candidatus Saccharimonadales bacterium]